ncbi:MAG: hypothetical protein HKN12_10640 [Gemmatimonadetes bacterium]|nr:hypothetical protein [Gemmatimonadota bacterium]
MKNFARALKYEAWANARTLESVRAVAGDAGGSAGGGAAAVADAVRLMAHIAAAQTIWRLRLLGEDSSAQAVWPDWDLDRTEREIAVNLAAFEDYERTMTKETLAAEITYRNSEGTEYRNTAHEVLRHLNRHAVYHRGQIASRVVEAGGTPAATDYIVWVREMKGEPAR